MTIVIVIDSIDCLTNGSVMTARRFADGLKARGHEVRIVAVGADGETDCPVKERYVPVLTEVAAKNQTKFGRFERARVRKAFEGADIVHFIFPFKLEKKCKQLADEMGIPATAAFHVQPENVSYNIHLGWCKPVNSLIYAYLRKTFYEKFDRIHCPSAFIANQLAAHGNDKLRAAGKRDIKQVGIDRLVKCALHDTRAVAHQQEQNAAVIAHAVDPTVDRNFLARVGKAQIAAHMRALHARDGCVIHVYQSLFSEFSCFITGEISVT